MGSLDIENGAAIPAGPKSGVEIDAAVARLRHRSGSLEQENWTRTGPLRLKCLRFAVAFRLERPQRGTIAGPVQPTSQPLISRWNMPGCHGISGVKAGLGRPLNRFGTSLLSN